MQPSHGIADDPGPEVVQWGDACHLDAGDLHCRILKFLEICRLLQINNALVFRAFIMYVEKRVPFLYDTL